MFSPTFAHGADLRNVLLQLQAGLSHHAAVLLAHLRSQEGAFGGSRLPCGGLGMTSGHFGSLFRFLRDKEKKTEPLAKHRNLNNY